MPAIYAFDVDHTLELSAGPVKMADLWQLKRDGHIVGLCGNWAVVTNRLPEWQHIISFIGPLSLTKAEFLRQLSTYIPADDFVMVGNDPEYFGESQDKAAAAEAGWRFIREIDFASGSR